MPVGALGRPSPSARSCFFDRVIETPCRTLRIGRPGDNRRPAGDFFHDCRCNGFSARYLATLIAGSPSGKLPKDREFILRDAACRAGFDRLASGSVTGRGTRTIRPRDRLPPLERAGKTLVAAARGREALPAAPRDGRSTR